MRNFAIILFLFISLPLQAQQARIDNLRIWAAPDNTRLVFDTSAPVAHELFTLKQPERLVIDIEKAQFSGSLPTLGENPLIRKLRSAVRKNGTLRVVLDLKSPIKPKSFALKPNQQYGHRLVIDLHQTGNKTQAVASQKTIKTVNSSSARDIVIAIDAGHGGEDPGAKGRRGTYEKTAVLAIAKKLAALVRQEPGMQPLLIRKGDYYLGLRKRMQLARAGRADLFISIHADAFRDPRARGSSVFTLSNRAASSEAAHWLAESENNADLIGGVKLDDKDDVLASVLLDLSQTGARQASHEVAKNVLKQLKRVGRTHKKTVQQAGFMVLKSPDVPSILIETAFISNPEEEEKLRSPRHQQQMAKAIMTGLRSFFRDNPPPGTLLAKHRLRRHTISRGDTLGAIANRYNVSLTSLRSTNKLSSDRIRIGQILRIPST